MEKTKKVPQNPEPEEHSGLEENAVAVEITVENTNSPLPTDPDQTEVINETTGVADKAAEPEEAPVVEADSESDLTGETEAVTAVDETVAGSVTEVVLPGSEEPLPVQEENVENTVPGETSSPEAEEPAVVVTAELSTTPESEVLPEQPEESGPSSVEPADPTFGMAEEQALSVTSPESLEETLEEHLDEVTEETVEQITHEEELNYETYNRAELVDLLETAVKEPDFNATKTRIALIKVAFLKKKKEDNLKKYEAVMEEGGSKEELAPEQDELDIRFNELFNIYKANKARHSEEQERQKAENLKKKFEILEELKVLINSEETLKKTYDEFKTLQERWKEIGMVPRTEINNLWQNYHFLVEKFFEKVKLNKELKDLDLKKNLEAKIALCEKTEELLLESSIIRSFKKLQKYHEEWKELGPVPVDKKDEIWERFKIATDKINERRREHYAIIEDEQNKNLETKTALCEQCEVVLGQPNDSIRDWQDNTNKINDLLKIWKNIGPVPQKVNSEIWNRFKSTLDNFFANKKEYFDKLKEQQTHNYNLKVELCLQAEALKESNDWKKTTNELIRLQGEWKKIGPVPRKHSDKIWKRFRGACDEFFNAKQSYFSNIQASEGENLNKKLDLLNRLKEFQFGEDKSANLEVLKNFQREWTDIGHVPMKEKDRLHNEFRTLINGHLDKLKISEVEISTVNYQARFDHLKGDPNAHRVIGKEREFLANKISKMKEEITLWENNIGFFAKSKSASIVKEEFENKINKAKSELKVLEAKMKILRQQA
ncbi:MAG TPA: DUF349 domain-containing protein [Bacteroidales bacterium]|nr:DUF349 domain-containing protein [Bacteroidales bacterium]